MKNNIIIMKMTDAYEYQSFLNEKENIITIDCRNISGTRCYLDDEAKVKIRNLISAYSPSGIHFIDSGNYHYLTLLWL